jgi:hypothetical protein
MLVLALAWEILKWMGRGARARLTAHSAQSAQ